MAICGNCGADTTRHRVKYLGNTETHECDKCAPGSFDPQWKHAVGVMGWEAYPDKYTKITLPDGRTGYKATDEMIADTEAKLKNPPVAMAEEKRALEKRRANVRRTPMTSRELEIALNRARPAMERRAQQQIKEKEDARYAWLKT
jgi:hypothetical protein